MSSLAREDTFSLAREKTCFLLQEKTCLLLQKKICLLLQEKIYLLLREKTCLLFQEEPWSQKKGETDFIFISYFLHTFFQGTLVRHVFHTCVVLLIICEIVLLQYLAHYKTPIR